MTPASRRAAEAIDDAIYEATSQRFGVDGLAAIIETEIAPLVTALEASLEFEAVDEMCRFGDFHEHGPKAEALAARFRELRDAALARAKSDAPAPHDVERAPDVSVTEGQDR